jgi:hypothetical protein
LRIDDFELDWELLHRVCRAIAFCYGRIQTKYVLETWNMLALFRAYVKTTNASVGHGKTFIHHLDRTRRYDAQDPRDHVYAVLGHYSAIRSDGKKLIECDYTKSKEQVFYDVACATLEEYDQLLALNAVQHRASDTSTLHDNIKSWFANKTHRLYQSTFLGSALRRSILSVYH